MIVIEVLNSQGEVVLRSRHQSFPVRIGRAYENNDVILDDEFVSPFHLSIESDSQSHIYVTDLNSENGVFLLPSRQQISHYLISKEVQFRIGHTTLRIRTGNFVLAPTKRDQSRVVHVMESFSHPWIFTGIGIVTAGWLGFETYWYSFTMLNISELMLAPIWMMVVISLWAGGWAMAGKTSVGLYNFKIHSSIACFAIVGFSLLEIVYEYYAFAFSSSINDWIFGIGLSGVIGIILWCHLRFCTFMDSKRLSRIAAVVAFGVVGVLGLSWSVATTEIHRVMSYQGELKAPMFQMSESVSVEKFFGNARAMKPRIDELIGKD